MNARDRLRLLGQVDLGAWVDAATNTTAWSVQRRIGSAVSERRARVAVPSCNASGKTWLGARLALAFYDAYTPGAPCAACDPTGSRGGCRGSKILTTSSKHEHLRDALWAEMRMAYQQLKDNGVELPGVMSRGQNLRLEEDPSHFIVGMSPNHAEGFQGFHAPHKLILGDEATSLDTEMQQGITGLLATGDSRLLLIFNPTTDDTYAALESRSPRTTVIKITAWDTPNFTDEPVPEGANLTTPEWLDELQDKGMGPGTYEWTTRVEADFWSLGDDVLIPKATFDKAYATAMYDGTRQLGIDLAPYGSDENVIAIREGNALVSLKAYPAMRTDLFFEGPVASEVARVNPHYLSWDADGVGSGAYGSADKVMTDHNRRGNNLVLLPFRGGVSVETRFNNARSAWWWNLRRRFESGTLALAIPEDQKLRDQITDIRYSITESGDIKVETKKHMKDRGRESPDRGDAVMYAFAMTDELPIPSQVISEPVADFFGVKDRSYSAMRRRDKEQMTKRPGRTPWAQVRPGAVWDDVDA
jgi:hypothetical protein